MGKSPPIYRHRARCLHKSVFTLLCDGLANNSGLAQQTGLGGSTISDALRFTLEAQASGPQNFDLFKERGIGFYVRHRRDLGICLTLQDTGEKSRNDQLAEGIIKGTQISETDEGFFYQGAPLEINFEPMV